MALPHTANLSQQWCREHFPNFWTKEQWPGNSLDLNPIEKLWAILKNKVYEPPYCTTLTQLKERIQRSWDNIDQTTLGALVNTYWVNQVRNVFERDGEMIPNRQVSYFIEIELVKHHLPLKCLLIFSLGHQL